MRFRTAQILFVLSFAAVLLHSGALFARASGSPLNNALRFFEGLPPGEVRQTLIHLHPAKISTEELIAALNRLPMEGELSPGTREAAKLTRLRPVLAYHARLDVLVKVIDVPQAAIGLYARGILLISRTALNMLTASELQALIAHELGHEYFWDEFYRARTRGETRVLQEVELKCDGIAVLALAALGLNVSALETGLRKVARFNEVLGATATAPGYPDISERARFVRAVLALRNRGLTATKTHTNLPQ
jgi:Peptidase family M48